MNRMTPYLVLVLGALGYATNTFAGIVHGTVSTADGRAVSGALLTLFNEARNRKETVYSAPDGSYVLATGFSGKLRLRARLPYFADVSQDIALGVDTSLPVDFTLSEIGDPQTLSDTLTASAHLTKLQWQDPALRATFVSQCNYCHQVGNSLTRTPRDEDAWRSSVERMESYFAMLTPSQSAGIVSTLARDFTPDPVTAVQTYAVAPELHHAKVHEWLVGDGMSFIHDAAVNHADDNLYGADEGHDVIWFLDRKTAKVETFALPDIDLPRGGVLSGIPFPIGVFTGKHGPHSLAQTSDGRFWITNALSSSLASFDPATRKFKLYELGPTHIYPHTVRVDANDIVWFTVVLSNEVIRFDPQTEQFSVIDLPHNGFWPWLIDTTLPAVIKIAAWFPGNNLHNVLSPHKWAGKDHRALFNFPYGIDVNPRDGSIWYAKLYLNRIGRIDPQTHEVQEFETPMKGPRRPRFAKDGTLWIPAFDDGGLMAFDTGTHEFRTWKLPTLAPNEYEVPYALNVHPRTGDIWITSNMSDRSFRFVPGSETFITYPSPTRVTWLRDWEFTSDGQACSSSSNLPSYAIEDGVPSFICIDPEGGAADRALLGPETPTRDPG
ncbi:MAG: carboxypeptidase regulatory-like domain-containing protein [Pseudomonadales bacterium]|nr:carboxypeptidase regulatory-like domain-containing protein [Gammaproteobacteria bacterium]MBP6050415.1 carboxypeptidase regulatory-like domain-containing protein [Pseudomonadales bacterium]MBK6583666.1 carboxypeptidase regulatory-like domain-containing protein [Gammaproteobacteria bacterium]MBK8309289.1 carboxypeptidase regulatory-like domain-containing protein [Gammaproteobacteria bacterium]MBK9665475.1 carboxypeptidase regulatory-like domain-containing protein [Gammaproteobacteria bacteriu